ncbi:MAG: hypothetical protein GWP14_06050 [Actinobacteria bacterium]|nr:hypothetical protein [Actinomycetota bacterium]
MPPKNNLTRIFQSRRRHYRGRVVGRRDISREFAWIDLEAEQFTGAKPGQFVIVQCADNTDQLAGHAWQDTTQWPRAKGVELQDRVALLRRPFSIADMPHGRDGSRFSLHFRAVGPGTRWLAENARLGAELQIIGPLGNGFKIKDVHQAILVAGGIGAAAMSFLAKELRNQGSEVVLLLGAKNRELLPFSLIDGAVIDSEGEPSLCCEFFSELGVRVSISTDDGSVGKSGLLSETLADYLSRHRELSQSGTVVYTCGPEAMMAKIVQVAAQQQLPCQVCMERHMACGLGACQACVCRQKQNQDESDWVYKLVCSNGPVFDGQSILW